MTAEGTPSDSILKELLKSIRELLFQHRTHHQWNQTLETRRYRDPRENDPDYGQRLRDLEGQIEAIDREQQEFHNINYPRPPKSETWQNKILVGVAIVVIAAAILNAVATYTAVATLTTQLQMYIQANDKRMDSDETRIQDTERRLDRGAP